MRAPWKIHRRPTTARHTHSVARRTHRAARRLSAAAVLLLSLAALLPSCGSAPGPEVSLKIQEARAAFHQAESADDCLRAAALYEEVLAGGFENGAVLFSQGNAYMRAGKKGLAVASYRRAERYMPRDPFLRNNLDAALDRDRAARKRTILDHLFFWQGWLSYPEKFQAAGGAAVATFLPALVGLFVARRSRIRRTLTTLLLLLTLLLGASAALDWHDVALTRHGVVVSGEVEARKGDSETFARAFSRPLDEGTEFVVREERGGWLLIRLDDGPEGWIPGESAGTW